jgi:hypothetical protein
VRIHTTALQSVRMFYSVDLMPPTMSVAELQQLLNHVAERRSLRSLSFVCVPCSNIGEHIVVKFLFQAIDFEAIETMGWITNLN